MLQRIFDYFYKRSTLASPDSALEELFGAHPSRAGVSVTAESSLKYTTVYACVSLIAETIASLPLVVYQRHGDNKDRATKHPLYQIIHDRPNEEMTSFNWREALVSQLLLWGNAYNYVERNRAGGVAAVYPLLSSDMTVERIDGVIRYRYEGVPVNNILHIPALGFNGIVGKSPVAMAKEAVGLGLAAEEFGAAYFGTGINPSVNVFHPGKLSKEAQDRLKESIHKRGGLSNSHSAMIWEEGMKVERTAIPPEDSQFLETRSFQRSEICAIYRVPQFMVGGEEKQTSWGTGVEQRQIGFVVHTIRPWLVRIEQVLSQILLSEPDRRKGYFVEFLVDGLLRGDLKSRYEAYQIGRLGGWLSVNEIRSLENLNPVKGGDEYIVPLNMAPADQLAEIQSGDGDE